MHDNKVINVKENELVEVTSNSIQQFSFHVVLMPLEIACPVDKCGRI